MLAASGSSRIALLDRSAGQRCRLPVDFGLTVMLSCVAMTDSNDGSATKKEATGNEPWTCPKCGEMLVSPPQPQICPKCGAMHKL